MKKLLQKTLFLMLAVVSILAVSCDKEDDPDLNPEEAQPTITAVSPETGFPGDAVTITGTNLEEATVTFGSVEAAITENTATSITTTVPDAAEEGAQEITVTTAAGSATQSFTVEADLTPTITAIEPESREVGVHDEVRITGTNFEGAQVFFVTAENEELEAPVDESSSAEELIFTVPYGAAEEGPVTIRTSEGEVKTSMFYVEDPGLAGEYYIGREPGEITYAIYDEELASDWLSWSSIPTVEFDNADNPQSGDYAIMASGEDKNWGMLNLAIDEGLLLDGYETVVFSVLGGAGSANQLDFEIESTDGVKGRIKIRVEEGQYRTYEIPLSDLNNPADIRQFKLQNLDAVDNIYYVDNIGVR